MHGSRLILVLYLYTTHPTERVAVTQVDPASASPSLQPEAPPVIDAPTSSKVEKEGEEETEESQGLSE